MEISQYDEYIPEKELDVTFKIPRKRTAEDSFGAQAADAYTEYYSQAAQAVQAAQAQVAQYRQYSASQTSAYTQYATLSGAASQATAYTNTKPPVQYSVPALPKLDTTVQPPLPPDYGTSTSTATKSYSTFSKPPVNATFNKPLMNANVNKPPVGATPNPYSAGTSVTNASVQGSQNTFSQNQMYDSYSPASANNTGTNVRNRNFGGAKPDTFNSSLNNSSTAGTGNRRFGAGPPTQRNIDGGGGGNSDYFNRNSNSDNSSWSSSLSNPPNPAGGGTRRLGGPHNYGGGNADSFDREPRGGNFGNRDWDEDNSGGGGGNRRFGGGPTTRNFGGGNGDSYNSSNRENFGMRNSGGGNQHGSDNQNEFKRGTFGGGNRWNSGGDGGGGDDYNDDFNDSPSPFGTGRTRGRGQFGGSGGRFGGGQNQSNQGQFRGGRFGGGQNRESDQGFDDQDGFGGNQKFGNRQGFRNQQPTDFPDEQRFDRNSRGGAGGNGRGGANQNWRGNARGGYRGAQGGNRGYGDAGNRQGGFGNPQFKKNKFKKEPSFTEQVSIVDLADETLPKELKEMFEALNCKLCSLEMTSNIMAKLHYSSKNHEKKIRKYLIEYADKTGEPLHPRALVQASQAKKEKEEDTNPKHFHCDVCDLPLTGKLHAESHYMGKSHNAVMMGKKQPSGKGRYDNTGKWVRDKTEKIILADGEDTFGLSFRKKPDAPEASVDSSTAPAEKPAPGQFTCSICNVACTCQEQINMHFNGARHKKKLRTMGISPENFEPPKEGVADGADPATAEAAESEAATPNAQQNPAEEQERNDFSKYKTPSGLYYCGRCNLTVNSEVQLQQHLTSKNHLKSTVKKTD